MKLLKFGKNVNIVHSTSWCSLVNFPPCFINHTLKKEEEEKTWNVFSSSPVYKQYEINYFQGVVKCTEIVSDFDK